MKPNLHLKKIIIAVFVFLSISFYSYSQNAGYDQTGCTNTYTLAANNPTEGSGQWSVISGTASFTDITLYNTEVNVGYGNNTLRWSVTVGQTTTFDDVVISNEQPSVPNAGPTKIYVVTKPHSLPVIQL